MAFTSAQGRTSTSLSEINVTPLVDVMLVLLIIFMVTAPMLQMGIEIEPAPMNNSREIDPKDSAILTITRQGTIYYGSDIINFYKIANRLKSERKNKKESIFLRADKDVRWESIVSVMDVIRGAGFTEIKLVVKPYSESEKSQDTVNTKP
jgi:biopolymer transport protein TolR